MTGAGTTETEERHRQEGPLVVLDGRGRDPGIVHVEEPQPVGEGQEEPEVHQEEEEVGVVALQEVEEITEIEITTETDREQIGGRVLVLVLVPLEGEDVRLLLVVNLESAPPLAAANVLNPNPALLLAPAVAVAVLPLHHLPHLPLVPALEERRSNRPTSSSKRYFHFIIQKTRKKLHVLLVY